MGETAHQPEQRAQKGSPAIQGLKTLIESHPVLSHLPQNTGQQKANIITASQSTQEAPIPRAKDQTHFSTPSTISRIRPLSLLTMIWSAHL
jgi:hypothetical protein